MPRVSFGEEAPPAPVRPAQLDAGLLKAGHRYLCRLPGLPGSDWALSEAEAGPLEVEPAAGGGLLLLCRAPGQQRCRCTFTQGGSGRQVELELTARGMRPESGTPSLKAGVECVGRVANSDDSDDSDGEWTRECRTVYPTDH